MAEQNNLSVSEYFTGHGVGELLHMPPMICHHRNRSAVKMEPGMVFTIEPILQLKNFRKVVQWRDEFTVVSPDNPSAQWEHMVLITENGYEVLTQR